MREVKLETNFNNKLGCDSFVHIQKEPAKFPDPEEKVKVITKDGSAPEGVFQVVNMLRYELMMIPSFCTLTSHNMDIDEFIKWVIGKAPDLNFHSKMAILFYRRVK